MPPIPTTWIKSKYKRFQYFYKSIKLHFIRANPSHQQRAERGRQETSLPSRKTLSDTRSLRAFKANKVTQHVSDGEREYPSAPETEFFGILYDTRHRRDDRI
eukprot:jgi/Picre1/31932/NNA_007280.t1